MRQSSPDVENLSSPASTSTANMKLLQPIQVGDVTLGHRIVMAPLTRLRANTSGVHTDMAVEYYAQRASVPGTLIITEATGISYAAGGRGPNAPGVWNEEQIAAWKRVAEAVHAKGSFAYMQLWALGRAARVAYLREEDPDFAYVSASDVPLTGREDRPRPLTIQEIQEYVATFAQAARNAVFGAGFDGVEIHGANGYLVDQFLQDVSNKRTDEYGGSVENRCRFALEVVDAVCKVVGEQRTAIRLSPWGTFQDMRMADPVPTFRHLVSCLAEDHPDLGYLHVIEPWAAGNQDRIALPGESNEFIGEIWQPRPLVSAGGYNREKAIRVAEETGQLIAFGRAFISNPDLPSRLLKNIPLTPWDPALFYTLEDPHGYIDYPPAPNAGEVEI